MILHITPDYTNKPLYQNLFNAIASQDFRRDMYVFVCDNKKHDGETWSDSVRVINRNFNILERLLFFPKQKYILKDIEHHIPLKEVKLIHAHTLFSSGYTAYQLYKKYGIPYVVAVRNTDVNIFFRHMLHLRKIGRDIAQHAQRIIFISPAYKNLVVGKYLPQNVANKSEVLPNGIDRLFVNNISQHEPNSDELKMIYIGRIERAKNIHTIIKVTDYLRQHNHSVKLCLVGDIVDELYKSMIDCRQDYIEWNAHCTKDKVLTHLRQNDIFIMPSYTETFGLVYAEAMSQGLPVIYTAGQGFDGFFADGQVGYAVPVEDVEYIAHRVIDCYKHYQQISNACIEKIKIFNWQTIAKDYVTLYQSIINN